MGEKLGKNMIVRAWGSGVPPTPRSAPLSRTLTSRRAASDGPCVCVNVRRLRCVEVAVAVPPSPPSPPPPSPQHTCAFTHARTHMHPPPLTQPPANARPAPCAGVQEGQALPHGAPQAGHGQCTLALGCGFTVWLLCGDRVACVDGVFVGGRVAWCDGRGVFRLFGMPCAPVRASGDEPVPAPGASAGNRAGGVRPVLPRELQVGRPHRCPRWLCPLTHSCVLRVQHGIGGTLVACMGFRVLNMSCVPACPVPCVPCVPCMPCVYPCAVCALCVSLCRVCPVCIPVPCVPCVYPCAVCALCVSLCRVCPMYPCVPVLCVARSPVCVLCVLVLCAVHAPVPVCVCVVMCALCAFAHPPGSTTTPSCPG